MKSFEFSWEGFAESKTYKGTQLGAVGFVGAVTVTILLAGVLLNPLASAVAYKAVSAETVAFKLIQIGL